MILSILSFTFAFCTITSAFDNQLFGSIDEEDRKSLLIRNFFRIHQLQRRIKREQAFDLLKLESQINNDNAIIDVKKQSGRQVTHDATIRRDDALTDEKCQRICNEKLRSGLDMVKAHSAFGSVGVPSVVDELDLRMFCRLDSAHDRCLKDCGFEIHFNMRDYICRDHFELMTENLSCYNRAAAQLKRKCGAQRCGPYTELEVSLAGFAQRCKSLVCDLSCMQNVLFSQCGWQYGRKATKFLVDYSRVQVSTWMRDISKALNKSIAKFIPSTCSRLFCDNFDTQNCTAIIENISTTSPTILTISRSSTNAVNRIFSGKNKMPVISLQSVIDKNSFRNLQQRDILQTITTTSART